MLSCLLIRALKAVAFSFGLLSLFSLLLSRNNEILVNLSSCSSRLYYIVKFWFSLVGQLSPIVVVVAVVVVVIVLLDREYAYTYK